MHHCTSNPTLRARISSALKLAVRQKSSKVTTSCTALAPPSPGSIMAETTLRNGQYSNQRSTKVPLREPAGFPTNQNFSQRLIYVFEEEAEEQTESQALKRQDSAGARMLCESYPPPTTTGRPMLPSPDLASPFLASKFSVMTISGTFSVPEELTHPHPHHLSPDTVLPVKEQAQLTPGSSSCTSSSRTPNQITPGLTHASSETPFTDPDSKTPSGGLHDPCNPVDQNREAQIPKSAEVESWPASYPIQEPSPPALPVRGNRGPGEELLAGLDFLTMLSQRKGPGLDEFDSVLDVESLLEPFEFS